MDNVKDMKDVERITAEKQPQTVEEALELMDKIIKENARDLNQKIKRIQLARGAIIEVSTYIESLFDELIIGISKQTPPKYFRNKAAIVKKVVKSMDPFEQKINEDFLQILDEQVTLRNLFAHVPINVLSNKLEFNSTEKYLHYFKGDLTLKDVSLASKNFMENSDKIMKMVPELLQIQIDNTKYILEINKVLENIKESEDKS